MSGLPKGWVETTVGDACDVLDSRRVPVKETERAVRVDGLPPGRLVPYFGATGQAGWIDAAIFNEPLVLLGEDGVPFFDRERHKAYLVDGPSWVNNHAHVLRPRADICLRGFLHGYLNQFDYAGYVTGTTRAKLTQAAMLRIPLPLPPLAEQRRIVEKLDAVLSRVESCRARLDNIPKLLKRFRQSVLAAATSGELTREWRGGGEAEWEETTVGEVCDVSGGKRLPKGHSLVSEDTGFPYVRVTDFAAFTVDSTGVQYVPTIAVRSIARYFITSDDVFISIAGTIGIVGRVPPELSGANLTENAARIIVGPRLGPSFLMYQLASPQLQRRMHRDKIATTQDKLGLFRVKALPIEVPPLAEQAEIVRRVEQLFGYADVVESKYTLARSRLERVTPSVLGKAFRGELVEGEEG